MVHRCLSELVVRPRHRRGWESQPQAGVDGDAQDLACVLVTDGDGSLNIDWVTAGFEAAGVRPRHRRGWESQPLRRRFALPRCAVRPRHRRGWESQRPTGLQRDRASCVRPRHRRGWESQRDRVVDVPSAHACVLVTDGDGSLNLLAEIPRTGEVQCVLVTDGDGSLNAWKAGDVITVTYGASSSPTGMGVSTIIGGMPLVVSHWVRPRHRRGWESQHRAAPSRVKSWGCASSSPTGMGVSTYDRPHDGDEGSGASSSPTGMGVSTRRSRGTPGTTPSCVLVTDGDGSLNRRQMSRARQQGRASSSPTGMGVSTGAHVADCRRSGGCFLVTDGDGSLNVVV